MDVISMPYPSAFRPARKGSIDAVTSVSVGSGFGAVKSNPVLLTNHVRLANSHRAGGVQGDRTAQDHGTIRVCRPDLTT